jgi:cysteine-rich repeat protein
MQGRAVSDWITPILFATASILGCGGSDDDGDVAKDGGAAIDSGEIDSGNAEESVNSAQDAGKKTGNDSAAEKSEPECNQDSDCDDKNTCNGSEICEDQKCVADDTPLADKSECPDGWCISGECVAKGCGDGKLDPSEECDKGADNGKADSGCNIACKKVACGNGVLESGEECDDGNLVRLDGCDPGCKIELAHRWSRLHIIRGAAPDFCVHKSNRFGDAYSADTQTITVATYSFKINPLQTLNDSLDVGFSSGESNTIMHLYDSTDTSMKTKDPEIKIGLYDSIPAKKWLEGPPIDFPFSVLPSVLDKDRLPKVLIAAEQTGNGKIASKKATHVTWQGQIGQFDIYDAMLSYVYDVSKLSTPQAHNRFPFSDKVKLPEAMGAGSGDPAAEGYQPAGIMCGAITMASQQKRLIDDDLASICCKPDNTQYRSCAGGKKPPDCDTYADILKGGCTTVCFENLNILTMSSPTCQAGCGYSIINPTEPDVDTDKDGKNDAYSAVFAFEGKRVRIAGTAEE